MPNFAYRAMGANGELIDGELDAADRADAARQLQARGSVPLRIDPVMPGLWPQIVTALTGTHRPVPPAALTDIVQRLATLLNGGIAIEESLSMLAQSQGRRPVKIMVADWLHRLRDGASLADALAATAPPLPPIMVSMARAGENSGNLAGALKPAILDMGGTPPLPTQIALMLSDALLAYGWVLVPVIAALALWGRFLWRDPAWCRWRDTQLLRLPTLGPAWREAEIARFARTFGALIDGGVALPVAMALAQPVVANRIIADEIAKVAQRLREGDGLAAPLAMTGQFPDMAIELVRIGEATGRLGPMLGQLADIFDDNVRRALARLLAILVPVLTIGIGLLVAGLIASVALALLNVNELIQ